MAFSPNQKYPGATDPNPNYKDGVFRDNSPATTNNGSPLKALDRNEQLALQEAMMNAAGFNYNGIADTPQASQMFDAYKASLSNGANLLSNHNFLIQSPDDSQPPPDATPRTYPPGFQIFSGVFANETTGILNLTYIDGRVSFSGGDFYMPVPNTGGVERLTEFVASVADFDGKPRTRGVSYALVGDEYRITVGVDALEDVAANPTPLGSVKFEQGGVATGHEAVGNPNEIANAGDSRLSGGKIWPVDNTPIPLGAQSTPVPAGISRLEVDTGVSGGELLYLWEPSGDFQSAAHAIANVAKNNVGGYAVTTNNGTYEFLTGVLHAARNARDPFGWGADKAGVNESTVAFQAAADYGPMEIPPGTYKSDSITGINKSITAIKGTVLINYIGSGDWITAQGANFVLSGMSFIPTVNCSSMIKAVDIDNVEIKENSIDGSGLVVNSGIEITKASGGCQIHHNNIVRTVRAIRSTIFFKRSTVAFNDIYGNEDGIYFENYVHGAIVVGNELHGNTGLAIHFEGETRLRNGDPDAPPPQDPASPLPARNCVVSGGNHMDNNGKGLSCTWGTYLDVVGNHCKSSTVEGFFFDEVSGSTITGNTLWANHVAQPYKNIRIGVKSSRNTVVGNPIAGQVGSIIFEGNTSDSIVFNEGVICIARENIQVTDEVRFANPDGNGLGVGILKRFSSGNGEGNTSYSTGVSLPNRQFLMNDGGDQSFKFIVNGDIELLKDGAQIISQSPNGTRYKLTAPDGGGTAVWVAV